MLYWVNSSESEPQETRILYVTRVKGNQKQNKRNKKKTLFDEANFISVNASQTFPSRSGNTSALEMFCVASGSRASEGHEVSQGHIPALPEPPVSTFMHLLFHSEYF